MQAETERQYYPENWDDFTEAAQHGVPLELQEDEDDEDGEDEEDYLPAVHPPNGECLSRIVQHWALPHNVDPVKVEPLLSDLMMYKNGLLAEQEEQCRTFLKMTQCWLK